MLVYWVEVRDGIVSHESVKPEKISVVLDFDNQPLWEKG